MAGSTSTDTPRDRGAYDAPHSSPVTPAEDARTIALNRVSWGAVLAGVVVSLVAHLIINMIGIGVGAAVINPAGSGGADAQGLGIGGAIWFVLTGIIAALIGGYAAGRLAGQPKPSTAGWHGLTTWALTTLVVFWLLTSAIGGLIGGAFSTLTGALGGAANVAGQTAQVAAQEEGTDPFAAIQDALGGAATSAASAVQALVTGDPNQAEQAREEAAQAIAEEQNISIEQARQQVTQYEQQYQQGVEDAGEQVTEVADTAADVVATTALLGAFALLLGAVAGWFGGRFGAVEPTITQLRGWTGGRGTTTATETVYSSTSGEAGGRHVPVSEDPRAPR